MGNCRGCNGNKTANRTFDYVKTMAANFAIVEFNDAIKRGEQVVSVEMEIYRLDDGFCFRPRPEIPDGIRPVYTVVYKG